MRKILASLGLAKQAIEFDRDGECQKCDHAPEDEEGGVDVVGECLEGHVFESPDRK
jgi:hypothetical protein